MIDLSKLYIDRPCFRPESVKAYLVAGLIVAAATLLRLELKPWLAGLPFITLFPAIIVTTFICGSVAGLFALLSALLSAWFLIIPPELSHLSIYQTFGFLIGSVTVIAVIGAMRAATGNVRRLNETLRISEGQFRGLLESAPDAMIIVDENRHIALVNVQTETLFGYARDEILGQPVEMLVPERSRAKYIGQLDRFMANSSLLPTDRVIDLHGLRKGGAEFPVEVSLGLLKTETGILVSSSIRDITAWRQIEASLAEASKSKSDFLASVSHELRTPLNAILGFSEVMRDAIMGPLAPRYRDYAGDINTSARHLQAIINDILDISKVENGRLELREEAVSIGETIEACRRIVRPMAETANVSLSFDMPDPLPLIRADRVRFKQILLNLISNAVKFTPAGGRVDLSAWIEADGPIVEVKDTGIGMTAEHIAIALEPFRQIDGALSRRFDGTGLGLPLANALAELHGGRLDIESALGEGTTARIRLPPDRVMADALTDVGQISGAKSAVS